MACNPVTRHHDLTADGRRHSRSLAHDGRKHDGRSIVPGGWNQIRPNGGRGRRSLFGLTQRRRDRIQVIVCLDNRSLQPHPRKTWNGHPAMAFSSILYWCVKFAL